MRPIGRPVLLQHQLDLIQQMLGVAAEMNEDMAAATARNRAAVAAAITGCDSTAQSDLRDDYEAQLLASGRQLIVALRTVVTAWIPPESA
jgi:LmbE family N-acetylglucosaminyl deacetylase